MGFAVVVAHDEFVDDEQQAGVLPALDKQLAVLVRVALQPDVLGEVPALVHTVPHPRVQLVQQQAVQTLHLLTALAEPDCHAARGNLCKNVFVSPHRDFVPEGPVVGHHVLTLQFVARVLVLHLVRHESALHPDFAVVLDQIACLGQTARAGRSVDFCEVAALVVLLVDQLQAPEVVEPLLVEHHSALKLDAVVDHYV